MEVDVCIALMRMTLADDKVVANLARMALSVAKNIRDAEMRAELAEAALDAERKRIAHFMAAVRQSARPGLQAV